MGKLITDETGKQIVEALNNTETVKQRIAEINTATEIAKQSALTEIQKMKETIPDDYSSLGLQMSMLLPSLVKTSTGNGVVNLTNTAENGVLKIISDSGVTVKNQNMFEDITVNSIQKTRCNVTYDSGTYTVEYTGNENSTFFFGVNIGVGNSYASYLGEKLKYNKNLSFRINCDKLTRSGCYITYFDADGLSIFEKNYKTNTEYKIEDVEGAEFFTMRIGFDYNNGGFTTGDIIAFTVQLEYGDTVSDFVVPLSNTDNISYEGITNIIGDGDITVEYVPSIQKLYDNLATAIIALGGSL